jgi:amino acid adenylation domain-containing protein
MLVEKLQPERNLSHTPLFQVMFVLDNNPPARIELPDITLSPVEAESGAAKFDLTLSLAPGPDNLAGYVEYNTDLFDRSTIERLLGHFRTLLEGIVADPQQKIATLPMLTEPELRQLLVEWNATAVPYPDNSTIHALFEEQAAQRPDAPAVIKDNFQLSYAELDRKANQLAHYLRRQGVRPGSFVGLMTGRSPEMVVGILGALKAGAAYIPIDPTYPPERQAFMIEDAQPAVILTTLDELAIDAPQAPIINLLADWPTIAQQPDDPPRATRNPQPDDLAYVIYTSGSTGQPKGTMLRHRGLCNLATWHKKAFNLRPGESRVLQFSPLSFDASVWETVMALRNGAALVLADQETLASGDALVELMREQRITTVTLPPSMLAVMPDADLPDLETIVAAGEACPAELVQRWGRRRQFVNAYGPTETTVCASMYACDPAEESNPPIGRPIDNFQLYVLDANLQPAPVGVPGELCVGGVGLAQGYLNRPEMTAQKFIAIDDLRFGIDDLDAFNRQSSIVNRKSNCTARATLSATGQMGTWSSWDASTIR